MPAPTITVLADWTGTDGTLPAGLSDQPIPAHGVIRTASNLGQPQEAGENQWCSCWWDGEAFDADQYASLQITTRHDGTGGEYHAVLTRMQAPGTGGVDGYAIGVFYVGGSEYAEAYLYRVDDGAYTQLGDVEVMGSGWGDGTEIIGVSEGDQHTLWAKAPAGSWTEIATRTDSTHTSSGYIGWWASNTTTRIGDMGGGDLNPPEPEPEPEPVTPPPRGWQAIITDRSGVARQYISPRDLTISPRLNGSVEVTLGVDLREGDTSEIMVGSRGLRLLREGVVRFQGPIVAPLSYAATPGGRSLSVRAVSPLGVLASRFLRTPADAAAAEFAGTDAGAIAEALLNIANGQGQTGLRIGDVDVSVSRDRIYELGKQIGEAIEQLAGVRDGFWFRDRPVSGEGAVWAALDILYPSPGVDRPGALFSFGEGTRDSVREFTVEVGQPVNDVLAIGALAEGDEVPLTARAEDATSVDEYGLWGAVVTYSDVSVPATLEDHAAESIEAEPPRVYTVRPLPTPITDASRAPRLWEEFDVGDTVRLTLRSNAPFDVSGVSARVIGCTLQVSDAAQTETLTSINFEVVA
ncbi:MAG: hypothetical protein RIB67_07445 [Miltoncostaeaceae bacterium]